MWVGSLTSLEVIDRGREARKEWIRPSVSDCSSALPLGVLSGTTHHIFLQPSSNQFSINLGRIIVLIIFRYSISFVTLLSRDPN